MVQTCTHCHSPFDITDYDNTLCQKFNVPTPDSCFDCNQKIRLCFRNGRTLYQRKCDATGTDMITIYAPDSPYKVYRSDYWHSDSWNALDYGRDFDPSRPFFSQLIDLQNEVPRLGILHVNCENSDYCNSCYANKDCYLIIGGDNNESCLYGDLCFFGKMTCDVDLSSNNELCYMMNDSYNCYNCTFTFDSKNCSDCSFISDCTGCRNCILCTSLTKREYCINNIQLTKEDVPRHNICRK